MYSSRPYAPVPVRGGPDHPRVRDMGSGEAVAGTGPAVAGPPEPVSNHGTSLPRGLGNVPRSSIERGRYGRMFRTLPPYAPQDATIKALADSMLPGPPTGPS